jgi:regulator of sigma E protease
VGAPHLPRAGRLDNVTLIAPTGTADKEHSLNYLAIVPILGILMIAHEFGHFITAKRSGIVVEEFAIGFPPRLFSFVRGGVRYSLNLIPLGAYVKMLGEEDPSAPGSFASQSKIVRAIVLAAGSGMNFLVAVVAFALAYASGMPDPNSLEIQIAQVAPGSPAEASGMQSGDTVRAINGNEVRSLDQFRGAVQQRQGQPNEFTVVRGDQVSTSRLALMYQKVRARSGSPCGAERCLSHMAHSNRRSSGSSRPST